MEAEPKIWLALAVGASTLAAGAIVLGQRAKSLWRSVVLWCTFGWWLLEVSALVISALAARGRPPGGDPLGWPRLPLDRAGRVWLFLCWAQCRLGSDLCLCRLTRLPCHTPPPPPYRWQAVAGGATAAFTLAVGSSLAYLSGVRAAVALVLLAELSVWLWCLLLNATKLLEAPLPTVSVWWLSAAQVLASGLLAWLGPTPDAVRTLALSVYLALALLVAWTGASLSPLPENLDLDPLRRRWRQVEEEGLAQLQDQRERQGDLALERAGEWAAGLNAAIAQEAALTTSALVPGVALSEEQSQNALAGAQLRNALDLVAGFARGGCPGTLCGGVLQSGEAPSAGLLRRIAYRDLALDTDGPCARWGALKCQAWSPDELAVPLSALCPGVGSDLSLLELLVLVWVDKSSAEPAFFTTRQLLCTELQSILGAGAREALAPWLQNNWNNYRRSYMQHLEEAGPDLLVSTLLALQRQQRLFSLADVRRQRTGLPDKALLAVTSELRLDKWLGPRGGGPKAGAQALLCCLEGTDFVLTAGLQARTDTFLQAQCELEQCQLAAGCIRVFAVLRPKDLLRRPQMRCSTAWNWMYHPSALTKVLDSCLDEGVRGVLQRTVKAAARGGGLGSLVEGGVVALLPSLSCARACVLFLGLLTSLQQQDRGLARAFANALVCYGESGRRRRLRLQVLICLLLRVTLHWDAVGAALPPSERRRHGREAERGASARQPRVWQCDDEPLLRVLFVVLAASACVMTRGALWEEEGCLNFSGAIGGLLGGAGLGGWLADWLDGTLGLVTDGSPEQWHDDAHCNLHAYAETLAVRRRTLPPPYALRQGEGERWLLTSLHGNVSLRRLLPTICDELDSVSLTTLGAVLPFVFSSLGPADFVSFAASFHSVMARSIDEYQDWVVLFSREPGAARWRQALELGIQELGALSPQVLFQGGIAQVMPAS